MICSLRILALILFCTALIIAQPTLEKPSDESAEKLQKEAIAFLRETLSDVNGMRSLENRISFTAELAGLMWFHDEREARSMYGGVITDFKDLLTKYDAQMNELGVTLADRQRSFMSFGIEPNDKSILVRRFTTAVGVRQQIAMSIAEHDAELAFSFYNDSLSAISNPEFRKEVEQRDSYFETQMLSQIAENSPGKAVRFGIPALKNGVTYQHVELLKKIYTKDAEKGIEFGAAMLSKLKSDKMDSSGFYVAEHLISYGEETLNASKKPGGKHPIYTFAELRDIAELLAQALLSRPDENSISSTSIETIQKYSPGRAAQIRAKFKATSISRFSNTNSNARLRSMSTNANVAYYDDGDPEPSTNANIEQDAREKLEMRTAEDVKKLTTKELPKEEREKIITQARKIILQTPGRDKKIMGLSALAMQVTKLGDKTLASEIMRDAESLVNPAPKNYQDFLLTWMLASGYATSDPDKAFPMLEETIGRANDTLAAFVKVGEFVDVAEEMIQDGEVQVGAFGGQMVRGLTKELGMADSTIQVLAKADFGKTKALTNRFDRAEIRILAKMMVLRAVLDPKKGTKPEGIEDVAY